MIKDNQDRLNRLHVVLDGVILVLSYAAAYFLIFVWGQKNPAYGLSFYFGWLYLIVPLFLILYWMFHLYTPKRVMGRRLELGNIFQANAIGLLIMTMILYLGKETLQAFSRPMVFLFVSLNVILDSPFRIGVRTICFVKGLACHDLFLVSVHLHHRGDGGRIYDVQNSIKTVF